MSWSKGINDYLELFYEMLTILGYKGNEKDKTTFKKKELKRLTLRGSEVLWWKIIKYKLDAFSAYWAGGSKLPKAPEKFMTWGFKGDEPKFIAGGRTGRFIGKLIKGNRRLELIQSFRSLKQACLSLSKEDLAQATKDEFELLTTQKPERPSLEQVKDLESAATTLKEHLDWDEPLEAKSASDFKWGESGMSDKEREEVELKLEEIRDLIEIRESIRRTTRELLQNSYPTSEETLEAIFPSTSANYINSAMNGGTITTLLDDPEFNKLRIPGGYVKTVKEKLEWRRKEYQSMKDILLPGVAGRGGEELFYRKVEEMHNLKEEIDKEMRRLLGDDVEKWSDLEDRTISAEDLNSMFYNRVMRLSADKCKERFITLGERPEAHLVTLPEPLKTRTISKMDPWISVLFKPIQDWLWRTLKKNRSLKLTGEVITWEYIQDVFGSNLKEDEVFVSSDYKNATGNLHSWTSELVAEEITDHIYKRRGDYYGLDRDEFETLLKKSLTGHKIIMKVNGVEVSGDQVNGQLMGSITSFPVLCIVNAATNRIVLDPYQPLKNLKMCFNGDDIAFLGSSLQFQTHERLTSRVGFILSDGKVFVSKKFVNMNSRFFSRSETTLMEKDVVRNGEVVTVKMKRNFFPVEYASLGTIVPNRTDYAFSVDIGSMGQRYTDSVARMPTREKEIHKLFMKYNKKAIEKVKVPWYIPSWLGGLGMTTPWTKEKISVLDRKIVNKIFSNFVKRQPKTLSNTDKIWLVWDQAKKFLESKLKKDTIQDTSIAETEGSRLYTVAMKFSCIHLLSDSNISLKDIYNGSGGNQSSEGNQRPSTRIKDLVFKRNLRFNEKLWSPKTYQNLDVTPVTDQGIDQGKRYLTLRDPTDEEKMAEIILNYTNVSKLLRPKLVRHVRKELSGRDVTQIEVDLDEQDDHWDEA